MVLLAGIYAGTPFNKIEISQADLDIVNKSRSNPLRWNGQFSPQLVQVLLRSYADSRSVIFDPFLGSGTVLLEAGLAGFPASGTEINPAAVALAQTYQFINVPLNQRRLHLQEISCLLQSEFVQLLPLFQASEQYQLHEYDFESIKSRLVKLLLGAANRLRSQLLETLIVLLDFHQPDLSIAKVFSTWKKLKKLVSELPFSEQTIEVIQADARQTPLPNASIDLVITSPPYINVFNYHQQYRASMEALRWNLLKVARSEIGSNRKHRGNRFLTVVQFCLDIAQTFNELARICRSEGRLIFVVGRESKVRGTAFFNGEIVAEVAHRASGFQLILKQERVFLNRFGQSIFEDILHFSPPDNNLWSGTPLDTARIVAQDILEAAYLAAPEQAKADIKLALGNIYKVKPSPVFKLPKTSKGLKAF